MLRYKFTSIKFCIYGNLGLFHKLPNFHKLFFDCRWIFRNRIVIQHLSVKPKKVNTIFFLGLLKDLILPFCDGPIEVIFVKFFIPYCSCKDFNSKSLEFLGF
jgi:hypothetical protein